MQRFLATVGAVLRRHVAPFFDPTALTLWIVSISLLLLIDRVMVETLVQWSLFFLTLAGVVVVISRLAFPMINLRWFVDEAIRGNGAAGMVVLAIALFMGLTLLSLVLWAKA